MADNTLIANATALRRLAPPTQSILGMPAANPLERLPIPSPVVTSPIPMQNPSVSAINARLPQEQAEVTRLQSSGSGISQIRNPFLRGLARVGDVAESVILPRIASITPGTEMNHQRLLQQAQGYVGQDIGNQQQIYQNQDLQAQAKQREALAQQEEAKAQSLMHPKGGLLYDKNGTPIGYQDPAGRYFAPNDPELDHGIREVLNAAQRKRPTNAFELWQEQNPKGTAEQYLALSKPEKDASLQQQYLDAVQSGDHSKAANIMKVIHDTQVQPKIDIHTANTPLAPSLGSNPSGVVNPTIQAYIDGRLPAPNPRTKQGAAILAQITSVDPTYDASRYNTYQAMQREMTSGKTGAAINSLNTIQEHIDRALKNMPDNTGIAPLNWLINKGSEAVGGNPTGKFEVDATGIAGEWAKLVAGGVASEGEQKHVQALLSPNASPQKMRDNLAEVKAMTDGKLEGIKKQIASASHPGPGSNPANSLPANSSTPNVRKFNPRTGRLE